MVDRSGRREQPSVALRSGASRAGVLVVVAAAVVIGVLMIVAGGGSDSETIGPDHFPSGRLQTLEGETYDLSRVSGTPTVVNFFASWCAPCRAEMPDFERVSQEVAGRVAFVGINTGETDVAAARQLVVDTGVTYTTLLGDDGSIFQAVGGLAMPTTAFVDATGAVVEVHSGILTVQALRDRIEEHFGP